MNKLTAFLLLLVVLLQYRLWFGDGNLLELRRLNDRIEELRHEGGRRQERNAALEAEIMDLKHGTEAIEERARQDLGMIKEGEVFVQVIEHHAAETPEAAPPAEMEAPKAEEKVVKRKRRARRPQPTPAEELESAPTQDAPEIVGEPD